MSRIDSINARFRQMKDEGAIIIDPRSADLVAELQSVQWSNLHDSSCVGRVCLNPSHMPNGGDVIVVTTQSSSSTRSTGHSITPTSGRIPTSRSIASSARET